jgi:hypothetical protein
MKINFKLLLLGILCLGGSCLLLLRHQEKYAKENIAQFSEPINIANASSTILHTNLEKERVHERKKNDDLAPVDVILSINDYLSKANADTTKIHIFEPVDSIRSVVELVDNAKPINDSLIELKYAREKITLLKNDSARFCSYNLSLIVDLKQTRETVDFYKTRWDTVERFYKVREHKGKLIITPKGRLKAAFWDLCKVGAGYFIGKTF